MILSALCHLVDSEATVRCLILVASHVGCPQLEMLVDTMPLLTTNIPA